MTTRAPRTDGCYVHKEPDGTWAYLCFYPDGTAGSVTAHDAPSSALPSLRARHPAMSFGPVSGTEDGYRVETMNAEGSVLYRIAIEADGSLTAATQSRINDVRGVIHYQFELFDSPASAP